MHEHAMRILEAAAAMYDCRLKVQAMGAAQSAESSPELASRVEQIAQELGGYVVRPPETGGGSEDYTYMMRRVQENGGLATNIGVGANLGGWGHHTAEFDIDERALGVAIVLLTGVTLDLLRATGA
jgi:aminobenzoyl-glutamate utilization protein A